MVGGIENEGEPMPRTRKSHPPSLKANVAVEAIKGHKTTLKIAQMFGVHPAQAGGWKNRRWPACRMSSATAASRSANRRREGRTLQADRSAQSGVGPSQKKIWPYRLTSGADGSTRNTRT
jgi:transposase-like protein